MSMQPISVIVITLNEAERIGKLLSDIANQTYRNFELIVVDSDSDDETRDIAQGFSNRLPELKVYNMQDRGVCLGRNTGALLANHERLLFLDADVRLSPDFLECAMESLYQKKLRIAGVYLNALHDNRLPILYRLGYSLFNIGMYCTQFIFPTAVGACIFSDKPLHELLGGFDDSITLCEDCDYVKRAAQYTKFRMLDLSFDFDPRRLLQDGSLTTARKYLHANIHRMLIGEIRNQKIKYQFNHYLSDDVQKGKNMNQVSELSDYE